MLPLLYETRPFSVTLLIAVGGIITHSDDFDLNRVTSNNNHWRSTIMMDGKEAPFKGGRDEKFLKSQTTDHGQNVTLKRSFNHIDSLYPAILLGLTYRSL